MGYFRLFLALTVVYAHFLPSNANKSLVAVYAFFLLSGFLITRVVDAIYQPTFAGKMRFLANRTLRIYPVYWTCLIISLVLIYYYPKAMHDAHSSMVLSANPLDIGIQVIIIGLSKWSGYIMDARPIPTAWSLSTEMVYYGIIGVMLGHNKQLVTAGFIVAVLFSAYKWIEGAGFNYFYFTIPGPAPIFLFGSILYHYRNRLAPYVSRNRAILFVLAFLALFIPDLLISFTVISHTQILPLWISSIIMAYVILGLYLSQSKITFYEQWTADLSYPVFLIHWPVFAMIKYYWPTVISQGTNISFFVVILVIVIFSYTIVVCVDHPIRNYRQVLRKGRVY